MTKLLGDLHIRNENDILSMRSKVYSIVQLMGNDHLLASKISTAISSFLKPAVKKNELIVTAGFESKSADLTHLVLKFKFTKGNYWKQLPEMNYGNSIPTDPASNTYSVGYSQKYDHSKLQSCIDIFNTKTRDELMADIQHKNKELKTSFNNLKKAKDLNARMEGELEVGKTMQMSMLPSDFIVNDKLSIDAKLIPAREVGGDFYDFVLLDDKFLYFTVGDVSGKGVPAALMMAVCKTLLRSRATHDRSTSSIISDVNNEIERDNKNYMFITVFLGILNLETGELKYTNAGHNPSYIMTKGGALNKLDKMHGPVVGAMPDIVYREDVIKLNKGDSIFTYTDGIPEAHNKNGELFTNQKLEEALKRYSGELIVESICDEVLAFEDGSDRFDDITAMLIYYKTD
jgi:sigma-B regulation protein RsbU (phosphoserine phosphatase)